LADLWADKWLQARNKIESQLSILGDKTQHLSAIHALMSGCWPAAVQAMLDRGWRDMA